MIVTVEACFSGSKDGLLVQLLDFAIEDVESSTQRAWERVVLREERRPVRSKNAQIEFGVEERDFEAITGRGIAVGVRNAMDQAFESKASQVVGHRRGGIRTAPERFHLRADIAIPEAVRQMGKAGEGLQDSHHARISKTER